MSRLPGSEPFCGNLDDKVVFPASGWASNRAGALFSIPINHQYTYLLLKIVSLTVSRAKSHCFSGCDPSIDSFNALFIIEQQCSNLRALLLV